ncbi:MAG TPA: DUF881 domain-containing protein [Propionibacteriaceae bacterium]|nr:DUF881 domain-containing protein [Propionibacteriaceae bacterium]
MPDDAEAPDTSEETSRSFLVDFLRPSRSQAVMAVILFLCGIAVVTQIAAISADVGYSRMRRSELVELLDTLNIQSRRLEADIAELESTKRQLESGVDASRLAAEQARQRLDELGILAGTLPAVGPGIRLTIVDPQRKLTPELLLDAIGELRDAGAEAIEINDAIRVVGSSWVGGAPGAVVVDGFTLDLPITIEAIGTPHSLEEGARFRGGLVSQMEGPPVEGSVLITQVDELTIDSVHYVSEPVFARPA